jgi:hypothetical protein
LVALVDKSKVNSRVMGRARGVDAERYLSVAIALNPACRSDLMNALRL